MFLWGNLSILVIAIYVEKRLYHVGGHINFDPVDLSLQDRPFREM